MDFFLYNVLIIGILRTLIYYYSEVLHDQSVGNAGNINKKFFYLFLLNFSKPSQMLLTFLERKRKQRRSNNSQKHCSEHGKKQ